MAPDGETGEPAYVISEKVVESKFLKLCVARVYLTFIVFEIK